MIPIKTNLIGGFVALSLLAEVAFAGAAIRMKSRCSEDSLSPDAAVSRVEWAARCGHITASEKQYSLEDSGTRRPQPQYPLFGTEDMGQIWIAPTDREAPCTIPPAHMVVAFCTSSCYTPEQQVLFPEGFVEIKTAKDDVEPEVMVVRDSSTFGDIKLVSFPVESYTEEVRPTWQDILHFKMKTGGELKVTTNHPIVDEKGVVKTADKFKIGDSLVHYTFGLDPIVNIVKERYFGKVYNMAPDTKLPTSNILVAQGYLNGSSYFQNEGVNLQNRKLLRRTLPKGLFY